MQTTNDATRATAEAMPGPSIMSLYREWDENHRRHNKKGAGYTAEEMAALCAENDIVMHQMCAMVSFSPADVLAKILATSGKLEYPINSGWVGNIRDEALARLNDRDRPDPLANAIIEYRAGVAALNAIPIEDITRDNEEALVETTYGPASDLLHYNTPAATSFRGVAEAIRLTFETEALIEPMAEKALRSALAYLDQEAPACGPTAATNDATGFGPVLSELLKASEDARTAIDEFDGDDFNDPVLKALCERRCELALAICGYRTRSNVEARRKVEFLRDWTECDQLTEEEQNALFASMMPEGGEA